jgi:hypothetical protein
MHIYIFESQWQKLPILVLEWKQFETNPREYPTMKVADLKTQLG